MHFLQQSQTKTDTAHAKLYSNPLLAMVLLGDADRLLSDTMSCMERIQRYLALSRIKPVPGRWPAGAAKQRDETYNNANAALRLLNRAQEMLMQSRSRVSYNPDLAATLMTDVVRIQRRVRRLIEQMIQVMVEAAIGRDEVV